MMAEKKYKIVQIIDTLQAGGAEKVLVTLSNILFSKGHDVTVLTTLQKGRFANQLSPGIKVKELNRKSKWNLSDMYRMIQYCKGFDVIHVHSTHNLRYVFLASKIFFLNKPIFFHHHYGNIETDNKVYWHQRIIFPSTFLIAVSRKIYDWALHDLKMNEQKVFLLPNIIAKNKFVEKRNEHANEIIQLVLVSNFRPQKNIEFAVELINELRKKINVQLTIVGQAADENYFTRIKEVIDFLELNDRIKIVFNCDDVSTILSKFDLAIHTATSESGPLVLMEYMAAGLPFVSYKTGEVVHQIINDLPECIIDNFEIDNWINKIQELLKLNTAALSKRLNDTYDKYYSEETYYQSCLNIYEKGLQLFYK